MNLETIGFYNENMMYIKIKQNKTLFNYMKRRVSTMRKILLTTAILASLVITSSAAFASVNTADYAAQSANRSTVPTAVKNNNEGTIEYVKQTMLNSDGSISLVSEIWVNTITQERREDFRCKDVDGTDAFTSHYLKENGTKWIDISRDAQGNAVNGTYVTVTEEGVKAYNDFTARYSFSAVKARYTGPEWKDEGIVQSADGKTLKKLSQRITRKAGPKLNSANPDKEINSIQYVYIDVDTGFPVKSEFYTEQDGTMKLQSSQIFEYKYVSNDGSLFETGEVDLKELNFENGVG